MIESCFQAVTDLEELFQSEWDGLQALAKDEGVKGAGRSRMGMELQRLCDEFLLSALADRGFLPGHGFPTGVVTFLPHRSKSDQPTDGRRATRLSGPQRSLDLAIRDYAPGSEIVLDGLVHKSAGVLLNWKRPATEENIRDVQSLKFSLELANGAVRAIPDVPSSPPAPRAPGLSPARNICGRQVFPWMFETRFMPKRT